MRDPNLWSRDQNLPADDAELGEMATIWGMTGGTVKDTVTANSDVASPTGAVRGAMSSPRDPEG